MIKKCNRKYYYISKVLKLNWIFKYLLKDPKRHCLTIILCKLKNLRKSSFLYNTYCANKLKGCFLSSSLTLK
jgi:hypothetical protein